MVEREPALFLRRFGSVALLLAIATSLPCATSASGQGSHVASAERPEPIEAFVSKAFFEGVPFNEANLYSSADVPILEGLLRDPSKKDAWRNAIATLGAIGTEPAKEVLLSFLFENPDAELSVPEYLAKSDVLIALGWLANQSGDKESVEVLVNATNEGWWTEEEINWSTPLHKNRADLISSLITQAIIGLTLTGTEEARIRLSQLKKGLDSNATATALSQDELETVVTRLGQDAVSKVVSVSPATRDAVLQNGGKRFVDSQLEELQTVQAAGLDGYYTRQ